MAARTAVEAVDAATATPPATRSAPPAPTRPMKLPSFTPQTLRSATKAASTGALVPLRQASRALWHELTGSFFALFALSFGVGVWHTRGNALSNLPTDRYRFYAFCGLTLLFAWFSVSSFVRASRRS